MFISTIEGNAWQSHMKFTASKKANPEGHWPPVLLYIHTFICRTEPALCQIKHCLPHIHIHIKQRIVQGLHLRCHSVSYCTGGLGSHQSPSHNSSARAAGRIRRGGKERVCLKAPNQVAPPPACTVPAKYRPILQFSIYLRSQTLYPQLSNSAIYYNHAPLSTPKNTQTPTDTLISTINEKEQYAAELSPTHTHKQKTPVYCHEWIFTSEQVNVTFEVRKRTIDVHWVERSQIWGLKLC